jgi:hypothetical protein
LDPRPRFGIPSPPVYPPPSAASEPVNHSFNHLQSVPCCNTG